MPNNTVTFADRYTWSPEEDELGRGGFAVVVRALDNRLDRYVAIKLLDSQLAGADPASFNQRFRVTAQQLSRLAHVNVVTVHDYGAEGSQLYLVMELLPGGSLADLLKRNGAMSWTRALELLEPVAQALDFAHRDLVHCDVKPQNILFAADGRPVLTDFGLARLIAGSEGAVSLQLTLEEGSLGTPAYMAPEQIDRHIGDISPATDVFALAVTFFQLVTAELPFLGDNAYSTNYQTVNASREGLEARLPAGVPPLARRALIDALAVSPMERPQSAMELIAGLRGAAPAAALIAPANAIELREQFRLGLGSVEQAVYSPDGRIAAVASSAGVYLYDMYSFAPFALLQGISGVLCVAFSLDGRRLAGGATNGSIYLWSLSSGMFSWREADLAQPTSTFDGHTGYVSAVAFAPDGDRLASGSGDGTARLWNCQSAAGGELQTMLGHVGAVNDVAYAPHGRLIASVGDDGRVFLWSAMPATVSGAGQPAHILEGHTSPALCVAFAPDGKTLASGAEDGTVRQWSEDSRLLRTLQIPAGNVTDIAFAPDGQTLAASSTDGVIRLWPTTGARMARPLQGHTSQVISVVFSADGQHLLSCSTDQTLRRWDIAGGVEQSQANHNGAITGLSFAPNGLLLAVCSEDGCVRVYGADDRQLLETLNGEHGAILAVAFSPDGRYLAAAVGGDQTVEGSRPGVLLWEWAGRRTPRFLGGPRYPVTTLAYSPDGGSIAAGSGNGGVYLWEVETGRVHFRVQAHSWAVSGLAFSPNGRLLVSCSGDGSVIQWETRSVSLLRRLSDYGEAVRCLSYAPNGRQLAIAVDEHGVLLLGTDTNGVSSKRVILTGDARRARSLAFSPDGRFLAAGSADGNVSLWDGTSGRLLTELLGCADGLSAVTFAPDSRTLAIGGRDGLARLLTIDD